MQAVLIEDTGSLEELVRDGIAGDPDSRLISLDPRVSYRLDLQKIPHETLRSYGGEAERVREGLDRFHALGRLTSYLDGEISHLHGIPALEPCRYATYDLKVLLDMLHCSVDILRRIIAQEAPGGIRIYSSIHRDEVEQSHGFSEAEPLFSTVLRLPGWPVPVTFVPARPRDHTGSGHVHPSEGPGRSRSASLLRNRELLFNAGIVYRREGVTRAVEMVVRGLTGHGGDPVLLYGSGYDWDDALLALSSAGCLPVHRLTDDQASGHPGGLRKAGEAIPDILHRFPDLDSLGRIGPVDARSFLEERIAGIVSRSLAESIGMYALAREIITRKRIRCLLLALHDSPGGHAAAQAARDAGIPVISWQHGGAGYCYHPLMPYLEFLHSDLHLVFGEGVAEGYRSTVERMGLGGGPRFLPTGSASLDRIRRIGTQKGLSRNPGPVVYITTSFLVRKFYHISQDFDPVTWDEHLWELQKGVVRLAQAHRDRSFAIKLHPSHTDREPLGSFIADLGVENIRVIVRELSVSDLVRGSTAVLLDHATTGILQAALFPVPLFVYTGLGGIDQEALRVLSRRASVSGTIPGFFSEVERFLRRGPGSLPASPSDDEFLMSYGTCRNDGLSALRAAEAVRGALDQQAGQAPRSLQNR